MTIFTKHALLKLKQRGISKKLVRETTGNPDYIFETDSGRVINYKKFGKLYLKVVFVSEGGKDIVITSFWDHSFEPKHL